MFCKVGEANGLSTVNFGIAVPANVPRSPAKLSSRPSLLLQVSSHCSHTSYDNILLNSVRLKNRKQYEKGSHAPERGISAPAAQLPVALVLTAWLVWPHSVIETLPSCPRQTNSQILHILSLISAKHTETASLAVHISPVIKVLFSKVNIGNFTFPNSGFQIHKKVKANSCCS